MKQKDLPVKTEALEEVQAQFKAWRQTRKKRSPIPEPLWKAAVKLSQDYGVNKIAKALRLDYYALKKRVHPSAPAHRAEKDIPPAFVELNVAQPTVSTEWIVEMETPQGAKMKIHLKGQGGVELVGSLLSAFWSK